MVPVPGWMRIHKDTGLGLPDQLGPIPIHAMFDPAYGSISLGDSGQLPGGASTAVDAPHALTAMLMHNHQLQLPFSLGSSSVSHYRPTLALHHPKPSF